MKNKTVAKLVRGGIVLLGTVLSAAIAACVHAAPEDDMVAVTEFNDGETVTKVIPEEEVSDPAE